MKEKISIGNPLEQTRLKNLFQLYVIIDTITYYCTNGVEEMLEINTDQTADFVITDLYEFSNQLF